ncbi:unnamed protein product [Gongylonema pulchrum]|uniref:adenylate cyclase n=1 Tax=Gongylonema pulchrum TaxID=637853 RepID=A0A183CYI4_9BILA|nr:unnamed protein product [Gongylonema pulchrum]
MYNSVCDPERSPTDAKKSAHGAIRKVLLRHWRIIDRARLQFFNIWLLIFSVLQTGLVNYLVPQEVTGGDVAQMSTLHAGLCISTIFQFLTLPRQRRLFVAVSVAWSVYNVLSCAVLMWNTIRQNHCFFFALVSLLLEQIALLFIGLVADANEAGSRADISLRLSEAVTRRTELQTLKDRQDQLLLSVIPAYLTDRVSKAIMATTMDNASKKSKNRKLFHELHVQYHATVSILFADIVNFTVLAAQLSAKELVRTLNELYSKFDQEAQKLQCMRIKFLGDCYYCVSGMPVNRPNHADMCVLMGLEMIKTIK